MSTKRKWRKVHVLIFPSMKREIERLIPRRYANVSEFVRASCGLMLMLEYQTLKRMGVTVAKEGSHKSTSAPKRSNRKEEAASK